MKEFLPDHSIQFDVERRRLVLGLSASLISLPGCAALPKPICPNDPSISDPSAPLTIDVHAHVFNGRDLQIAEFLAQTTAEPGESEFYQFVRAMTGNLLQAIAWHGAPSARDELRALDRYSAKLPDCNGSGRLRIAAADAFEEGYRRGRSQLQQAAKVASREPAAASVLGPSAAGSGLAAAIEALPATYEKFVQDQSDRQSTLGSQPHFLGYISFVLHHFNFRYVNVLDYLTTYDRNSARKIDLLVPSLVDYDWWLARGNPTPTKLDEQVDIMGRLAVITGGRVHGFVPFCPFRETMTLGSDGVGDSLRRVKHAVLECGFIGVKLYPPMGFAAWGNSSLDVWKGKPTLPRAAWEPGFGKRLDAAMKSLFVWCKANDVPIMAHANRSNGPYSEFRELAGSEYWQRAIDAFPGLRVSFGHFGDTDLEDHQGQRTSSYLALMNDAANSSGENVFADSAYFGGVLLNPVKVANVLAQLYANSPRDVLKARLMYGTDWTMILPLEHVESYLTEFAAVISRIEAAQGPSRVRESTLANAFFGLNAATFLGLRQGDKNRQRLEVFYERRQVTPPDWMRKIA
jgi:predicted TIM-barrel fold metal-dependent hydrolase